MTKYLNYLRNYKISLPIAAVVIIAGFVLFARGETIVKRDTVLAARATVAQEISVTGRVVPADEVNLAVQSGGKVSSIPVKVGQQVYAGQTLLRVDDADLRIRLGRQQAALSKAKLADASGDVKKAYEDGANILAEIHIDLPAIVTELDDLLNNQLPSGYLYVENIRPLGSSALDQRNTIVKSFATAKKEIETVQANYKKLDRNLSPEQLEAMLNDTYIVTRNIADVIKNLTNLIDYIDNQTENPQPAAIAEDQEKLQTYTKDTNEYLTNIVSIRNTIKNSRTDITSNSIDVRQAELDIQDTQVQIANRTIKSPVAGIVTNIDARVGETISASAPIVSVISANVLQIEANLPEVDIAKIKIGSNADVTLDAYGSDVIFKAKVVSVDPAETLVEGVATYKTTFQFVGNDSRIKSGMTANVDIKGESKANVIAIPQRAVIVKNNNKFVQVLEGEKVVDKPVQTGLRGSDGSIEIISGISEGDNVVVFSEK
ncbi:efflux RND transporter periplasmic adaptor subunit [Candidatus Parcubacteria bacterium]|nr:efflux RND transporter periplasmic adaptor subunit [Candidatus Parcubacteria bacterium]